MLLLLEFVFLSLDNIEEHKIKQLVNAARQISSLGIMILTFTNSARLPMAKHFLCNLKHLNLENSTLMIASDAEAQDALLNFETNVKTIFLPSNTGNSDLRYGSRGFKDFIEYRYAFLPLLHCLLSCNDQYLEQQLS